MQPHHQKFLFGENPGKICGNFGKICENVCKIAVGMCFDFTNIAPKIKVQTFFSFGGHVFIWFFSGKLKCFDFKKCAKHEKKCSLFLELFSGKFGEI